MRMVARPSEAVTSPAPTHWGAGVQSLVTHASWMANFMVLAPSQSTPGDGGIEGNQNQFAGASTHSLRCLDNQHTLRVWVRLGFASCQRPTPGLIIGVPPPSAHTVSPCP